MSDDVSIKVAVGQAWGTGEYPAFSLRRLYPHAVLGEDPAGSRCFLHELIVHRMIHKGFEYRWSWENNKGCPKEKPVCKTGEYEANLVAVEKHQKGYLAECSSHIYRLLSDFTKIYMC